MQNNRYPKIFIRSKNELAKHISGDKLSREQALVLINNVQANFEKYWKDNESKSEPEKGKFVRSAAGTPLGRLLMRIDKKVLAPQDKFLPPFIFGGVKGKNNVAAARHLLGDKRKRTLLKMDITRFFEQMEHERVYELFLTRFQCDKRTAKLIADFCCVPEGKKNGGGTRKTIGRGFATSSRLAVWCNLDVFLRLNSLVQKRLKGKDPRVAIYVDDIGVTASRVTKEEMESLRDELKDLLMNFDRNQPLPVKDSKTKITSHGDQGGMQHLGIRLERNNLKLGKKARGKREKLKEQLKGKMSSGERYALRRKMIGMNRYKNYVERQ